jgi:hypothetical protein
MNAGGDSLWGTLQFSNAWVSTASRRVLFGMGRDASPRVPLVHLSSTHLRSTSFSRLPSALAVRFLARPENVVPTPMGRVEPQRERECTRRRENERSKACEMISLGHPRSPVTRPSSPLSTFSLSSPSNREGNVLPEAQGSSVNDSFL